MPIGLQMDRIDATATPECIWVHAGQAIPPGTWERHWHNPRPVTPLYADFEFGSHLALSEVVAYEEFRAIEAVGAGRRPRRLYLVIDGFAYRGEPAPGHEWGWLAAEGPRSATPPVDDDYEWQVIRYWQEFGRASIGARLRAHRRIHLVDLTDAELRDQIRALSRELVELWARYFTVDAAAAVVRARAQAFFTEHLGTTEAEFVQLISGASTATSEPLQRLDTLARTVLANPTLFDTAVALYIDEFGHRATEWEYIGPTLAERPGRAADLLRESIGRARDGQPNAADFARARRDRAVADLRARMSSADLRITFDRMLREAQDTFAMHEENANLYMLGSGYMRYVLLEAGTRLAARRQIAERDHVFFMRRGELEHALLGIAPNGLKPAVEQRMSDYERQLTLDPPQVVHVASHGAIRSEVREPSATQEAELHGLGASAGTYVGRARVIVGEDEFEQVQSGEVLICPQTSPTWTILFGRIGALVTDDGGILSHPAIAAREFGLPAVVATGTATRMLETGQIVAVDGAAGTVRVVQD